LVAQHFDDRRVVGSAAAGLAQVVEGLKGEASTGESAD